MTWEIHPTIDANYYKGYSHQRRLVCIPTNTTNTPTASIKNTTKGAMTEISEQLKLVKYQTTTCLSGDFLARLSVWLEKGEDLKILEELYSLKLLGSPNKSNHAFYCLRMSKDYYHTTQATHLKPSSGRLMNWGMTANGKCLTAKISQCHKTENECSLSDILEERVDQKYFLSEEATQTILKKSQKEFQMPKEYTQQNKQSL